MTCRKHWSESVAEARQKSDPCLVLSLLCISDQSGHISGRVFVFFPQWFQIDKLLTKYHTFIWIPKRTIKEKHLAALLLTASLTQEGDLNTLGAEAGFDFQVWGDGMLQLKRGGRELVSQHLKPVGARRGSRKDLYRAAETLFKYAKHLSCLETERWSGRPMASKASLPHIFSLPQTLPSTRGG